MQAIYDFFFHNTNTTSFFNFSFLPKYSFYFIQGMEYTLMLSVVA